MQRHQRTEPLIISAGFPCQDVSTANPYARGLDGEKTGLFWEALRIVDELQPEYLFLENVAGLVVRGRGWGRICTALAKRGYCVWYRIVSAQVWGFPFEGKRLLAVAFSPSLSIRLAALEFFDEIFEKKSNEEKVQHLTGEISHLLQPANYEWLVTQDNGIPRQLVERRLHAIGNSIQPAFSTTIFKTIKEFHQTIIK